MKRVFSAAYRGGRCLVHDPATGLTHTSPSPVTLGRVELDEGTVSSWPIVHPGETGARVPISVCWSPLVRCNLSCPHCLDDKTLAEQAPADRLRIARLLAGSQVMGVDISGGEPLLLRDLSSLCEVLVGAGLVVSLTTNGWHLERRAPELRGRVDAVAVSLDGPTAHVHDAWRGKGSFDRALVGVRACTRLGLRVQLQTVLMADTTNHAQQVVDLAADLGAGGVTFLQMLPIGDGAALAPSQMLNDTDAQKVVDGLTTPKGVQVRLRRRDAAGGFSVIRADGRLWRNAPSAEGIGALRVLREAEDLALDGRDGSA
ncbi:radical SAM protein [Nocardiopsis dassonvillei]|uniref:radical SAM protein n=1 Tax=Nocardiopsis dassonvillei TaxID=2014 RepID=UPI00034B90E7|nr:radical SAM protein [Nocardiopsis dassonvillei]MCK9872394.1 radical SAM protein [Nocardiopsis dassonvillei]